MVSRRSIAFVFHPGERYVLLFLIVLLVAWQLVSLGRYPLPWFDEVYFASIATSYAENGDFVPKVVEQARNGKEALSYGPVYFLLNSTLFQLVGSGLYQARLITLLSGFAVILLLWSYFRKLPILWVGLLMLSDPFFSNNLHEGRMELLAMAFALAAWATLEVRRKTLWKAFWTGIFLGLAFMTTPRAFIYLFPFVATLIQQVLNQRLKPYLLLIIILVPSLLYVSWIYVGYGGIMEWIMYYKTVLRGNAEAPHGYLGGNFYVPKHEYLLLALASILFLVGSVLLKRNYYTPKMFLSMTGVILFYLIIFDWGVYSVLIIPFFYLIIFDGLHRLTNTTLRRAIVLLLLLFNGGYQYAKIHDTVVTWPQRDAALAKEFMDKYIPIGEKVIGSSLVYYAVSEGRNFQLYDKYLTDDERTQVLTNKFGYSYFVVAANEMKSEAAKRVLAKNEHLLIAKMEKGDQEENTYLNEVNNQGYEIYIWKRTSN